MKLILTLALVALTACGPTAGEDEDEQVGPKPAPAMTTTYQPLRVPALTASSMCPRDDAGVVAPTAQ